MAPLFIERRFDLHGEGDVVVRFFQPEPEEGSDYRCDYKIVWPDRERNSCAFGIDAVQALILAMQLAHVELRVSPEGKAGMLRWLSERELGLPLPGSAKPGDFG